jgi:hypothetical protein
LEAKFGIILALGMHCIDKMYINKLQAVVDYKDVNFDQKLNAKSAFSAMGSLFSPSARPAYAGVSNYLTA